MSVFSFPLYHRNIQKMTQNNTYLTESLLLRSGYPGDLHPSQEIELGQTPQKVSLLPSEMNL